LFEAEACRQRAQAKAEKEETVAEVEAARDAYKVVAKALADAKVGLFSQEVVATKFQLSVAASLVEEKYEDLLVAEATVEQIN